MVNQCIVLGHIISSKGIEVDKSKINLIRFLPLPTSVQEIRAFLGHTSFYSRFIKDFSKIAHSLCQLMQKECAFNSDDKSRESFEILKDSLTSTPIIRLPDWGLPFEVICDASDYAVRAVLGQQDGNLPYVIYHASRTLNDA